MKTSEAALLLRRTDRRVRQMVAEGLLPGSIRLGKRVLHVPASAVFAVLQTSGPASCRDASEPAPCTTTEEP